MCTNKHEMKLVVSGRPLGIICDVCGVKIDQSQGFYYCEQGCDEDLCKPCNTSFADQVAIEKTILAAQAKPEEVKKAVVEIKEEVKLEFKEEDAKEQDDKDW